MTASVVLITGALTGIGRATAFFAEEGSRMVVSGRRDEAGRALTQELRGLGVEAEFNSVGIGYVVVENGDSSALIKLRPLRHGKGDILVIVEDSDPDGLGSIRQGLLQ
jgi:NADP-dependent 3-hydroxy acid dehydrogenase YdfG